MTKLRWKIAQYFEIRWWQRYLKKKSTEDYLQWKTNYWRNFLKQINVSPEPGSTALDAGCGPAGIFTILDNLVVDAVDPLVDMYEEKLQHFKRNLYPFATFYSVPLEEFKPEKAYRTVFCLNAINHVNDLGACFDNLVSFVAPGGELVVSIDAHNYKAFKHIFRTIQGDILHPHQYDLHEYREMLTSRGMEVTGVVRCEKHFLFDYYVLVCRKPAQA